MTSANATNPDWTAEPGIRSARDYADVVPAWLGQNDRALAPFAPILAELLRLHGDRRALDGLDVVELGPGRRTRLSEKLSDSVGESFACVGLPRFRTRLDAYRFEDINAFLDELEPSSLDLVVSRFVLEENSFHPLTLLRSSAFRSLVARGRNATVMKDLPGSAAYLELTAERLARVVRPSGYVVGYVVDRRRAERFLEAASDAFETITRTRIGWRMGLFTLRRR